MLQVNNAATVTMNKATNYDLEEYSTMMSTNVESPYHLSQLAHPLLKASGKGSIVFISSIAGVIALPRLSAYAASKGKFILILGFVFIMFYYSKFFFFVSLKGVLLLSFFFCSLLIKIAPVSKKKILLRKQFMLLINN